VYSLERSRLAESRLEVGGLLANSLICSAYCSREPRAAGGHQWLPAPSVRWRPPSTENTSEKLLSKVSRDCLKLSPGHFRHALRRSCRLLCALEEQCLLEMAEHGRRLERPLAIMKLARGRSAGGRSRSGIAVMKDPRVTSRCVSNTFHRRRVHVNCRRPI